MLSQFEIQKALHATRVVPVPVPNPHGPLGLEHLALAVAQIQRSREARPKTVMSPLEIPVDTWDKLEQLAESATKTAARPVSVSEVALAILQLYVANPL